tara:strand:- start:309 stop:671 length:363 start_codon:yes stop_codon:yes gene_type:complete
MDSSKSKNVHTMIGPDATINGPIRLKQGLIVYGKIYGDVITRGPVRVAKNGLVQGNVEGSSVIIGGTVIGNIKSERQVTLRKNCVLKGDISYRKLHIEDGAQFEGQCDLVIGNKTTENMN